MRIPNDDKAFAAFLAASCHLSSEGPISDEDVQEKHLPPLTDAELAACRGMSAGLMGQLDRRAPHREERMPEHPHCESGRLAFALFRGGPHLTPEERARIEEKRSEIESRLAGKRKREDERERDRTPC